MRISIDPDRCTGHGRCYTLAAQLFDADDEGRGFVIAEEVDEGLEAVARRAAENCPERAVLVT